MTLIAALEYLLQQHGYYDFLDGKEIDDWLSVSNLDPVVSLDSVGGIGTWPRSNDAVVLIQDQSIENPYTIDSNGFQRPNMINHYFPVVDWIKRLVYNTETNETISFADRIVTGWASYNIAPKPPVYDKSTTAATDQDYPGILYERFPRPRRMYVSKPEGTNKVDFGKAANWNEIGKSILEHVDYGTEIYILGQAHHPMPPVGGIFLMDAAAMGTFSKTGRAAQTHGYVKEDLHDHLFSPTPPPDDKPEPEEVPAVPPIEVEPEKHETVEVTFDDEFKKFFKAYRDKDGRVRYRRYQAVNIPKHELFTEITKVYDKSRDTEGNVVVVPRDIEVEMAWIRDLRTGLPRKFKNRAEVDIVGEFTYHDKVWGMPAKAILDDQRFGIDMNWLVLKSELYNTTTTVEDRKELKTLKPSDYITIAKSYTEAGIKKVFDIRRIRKQKVK